MKKPGIIFLMAALMLAFFSCSSQKASGGFPYGSYSYRSYNLLGDLVGDGTLYISRTDSNLVEGNWAIRNVRNCFVCGPQYGQGYFTGRIENDSLFINLNPDKPENYVELYGKFDDGNFSGEWRWFELIINSNRGTFKAEKM